MTFSITQLTTKTKLAIKNLLLIALLGLTGCGLKNEISALNGLEDKDKIWVFVQFNVRAGKDDLDTYYYYAMIPKKIFTAISNNELTNGFILLTNAKYWGEDDLITDYKNKEKTGELVFRIENIAKMNAINIAPVSGLGVEQFYENAEKNEPKATTKEPEKKLPPIDPHAPLDAA